jgi:putative membrane protein
MGEGLIVYGGVVFSARADRRLASPRNACSFSGMNSGLKPFLIRWFCTTVAVAAAVALTGMEARNTLALVCAALFLGIINASIRPILLVLSVPFIIVSLGFFILILNALLLWLAGGLVPGFIVNGFWNAFFGAIVVSLVNFVLSLFIKTPDGSYRMVSVAPGGIKQVQGRVVGEE